MALYISKNGERLGPYSSSEVQNFLNAGTLQPSDLAWYEGLSTWTPLDRVPGISAPLQAHSGKAPHWERPEAAVKPKRPLLLSIIAYFFLLTTPIKLLLLPALQILLSGAVTLPGFTSKVVIPWPITVGEILTSLLLFTGAIKLLALRRSAMTYLSIAFVLGTILSWFVYTINPFLLGTTGSDLRFYIEITIKVIISMGVIAYLFHLTRRGILQ